MVIPFNLVPFKLEFSTSSWHVKSSDRVNFTDDVNDLNNKEYDSHLSIRENSDFFVENLSSKNVIMRI